MYHPGNEIDSVEPVLFPLLSRAMHCAWNAPTPYSIDRYAFSAIHFPPPPLFVVFYGQGGTLAPES